MRIKSVTDVNRSFLGLLTAQEQKLQSDKKKNKGGSIYVDHI